jgi:hypothetical protein
MLPVLHALRFTYPAVTLFVLPNLVALAVGNKQISRLLSRRKIVVIRDDFGAKRVVLCHAIIVPDPCDLGEQTGETFKNDLILPCYALHYSCNFLAPRASAIMPGNAAAVLMTVIKFALP